MSREAAMACTEAVETVIGEHYDEWVLLVFSICLEPSNRLVPISKRELIRSQLKSLKPLLSGSSSSPTIPHPSLPLLADVLREFRDDELEHLDLAVEEGAQKAPGHSLLSAVIGWGCKAAIQVCKRV